MAYYGIITRLNAYKLFINPHRNRLGTHPKFVSASTILKRWLAKVPPRRCFFECTKHLTKIFISPELEPNSLCNY